MALRGLLLGSKECKQVAVRIRKVGCPHGPVDLMRLMAESNALPLESFRASPDVVHGENHLQIAPATLASPWARASLNTSVTAPISSMTSQETVASVPTQAGPGKKETDCSRLRTPSMIMLIDGTRQVRLFMSSAFTSGCHRLIIRFSVLVFNFSVSSSHISVKSHVPPGKPGLPDNHRWRRSQTRRRRRA